MPRLKTARYRGDGSADFGASIESSCEANYGEESKCGGDKKDFRKADYGDAKTSSRPPRALLTAVELMKITEAVATAVGSNRCAHGVRVY